jgi:regulator of RNase E activity RraA
MKQRQVAALVTDGVVRDVAGVLETKLPVCAAALQPLLQSQA